MATAHGRIAARGGPARTFFSLFWSPSLTRTDPAIPRLPLETVGSEVLDFAYTTARAVRYEIVRRADATRYDWTDATFKSEGWGIRQKPATEDGLTLGWYRGDVEPALWDDGEYLLIVDDAAVTTGPLKATAFSVVAGKFAHTGAGLARAVWCQDVAALDEKTLAGVRAATWFGRFLRRHVLVESAKFTRPSEGVGEQVIFDGSTAIATLTESDDETTSTIEDPV